MNYINRFQYFAGARHPYTSSNVAPATTSVTKDRMYIHYPSHRMAFIHTKKLKSGFNNSVTNVCCRVSSESVDWSNDRAIATNLDDKPEEHTIEGRILLELFSNYKV